MPHQQQAARQPRRHVITYQDVCRANDQVTRELDNLGFWSGRLNRVNVYWVPASLVCYGWYLRHIYIPAITGAQLSDLIFGRHTRLTDVLRHEWAHAVADRHQDLIDTKRFERVFGGPYESDDQVQEYHPDRHLTEYAATMPCEDFRGSLPLLSAPQGPPARPPGHQTYHCPQMAVCEMAGQEHFIRCLLAGPRISVPRPARPATNPAGFFVPIPQA